MSPKIAHDPLSQVFLVWCLADVLVLCQLCVPPPGAERDGPKWAKSASLPGIPRKLLTRHHAIKGPKPLMDLLRTLDYVAIYFLIPGTMVPAACPGCPGRGPTSETFVWDFLRTLLCLFVLCELFLCELARGLFRLPPSDLGWLGVLRNHHWDCHAGSAGPSCFRGASEELQKYFGELSTVLGCAGLRCVCSVHSEVWFQSFCPLEFPMWASMTMYVQGP